MNRRPGIRAVDSNMSRRAPPPRNLPMTKRRVPGARTVPPKSSLSESSEESSDVSPIVNTRRSRPKSPYYVDDDDEIDETLFSIANGEKLRKAGQRRRSLSSADSSERHNNRKKVGNAFHQRVQPVQRPAYVSKLPAPKVKRGGIKLHRPPPRPKEDSSSSSSSDLQRMLGKNESSSSGSSYDSDSDDSSDNPRKLRIDPMEEETIKAVRKAKLLARIEQMETKGVKRSKAYNYRSSEEELMVEVARMEVLAERAVRIEQGRAFLMTAVNGAEKGSSFIDRKGWLPFNFNISGFSKQLHKDIDKYDDCLERGVADTLGPGGSRVWWMDLLTVLLPSMAYYSMTNRITENSEYANEVIRNNPEFQSRLAQEMAKELSHTTVEDRRALEDQVKQLQLEIDKIRRQHNSTSSIRPLIPEASPSVVTPSPPVIGRMAPPPKSQPTNHPLGDFPVVEEDFQQMQQLLTQQKNQSTQKKAIQSQIRNEVQKGLQEVSQNVNEVRQQTARQIRKMEMQEEKRAREQQQKAVSEAVVRRKIPDPPSKRPAVKLATIDLGDESSESEVESL